MDEHAVPESEPAWVGKTSADNPNPPRRSPDALSHNVQFRAVNGRDRCRRRPPSPTPETLRLHLGQHPKEHPTALIQLISSFQRAMTSRTRLASYSKHIKLTHHMHNFYESLSWIERLQITPTTRLQQAATKTRNVHDVALRQSNEQSASTEATTRECGLFFTLGLTSYTNRPLAQRVRPIEQHDVSHVKPRQRYRHRHRPRKQQIQNYTPQKNKQTGASPARTHRYPAPSNPF